MNSTLLFTFTLRDRCGNVSSLHVRERADGELVYVLHTGVNSGISEALDNLGIKVALPRHAGSMKPKQIGEAVAVAVKTGYREIIKTESFVPKKAKATKPSMPENNEQFAALLLAIAKKHFGVETLAERKSDSLDFHNVSVWQIEAALKTAFMAGAEVATGIVK